MTSSYHKDKYLKAWLNYNCTQGNNWVVQYRLSEMISHTNLTYAETNDTSYIVKLASECKLVASDMRHIYFTHMTNELLITLIQTYDGTLYLIHNSINPVEPEETSSDKQIKDTKISSEE